jgi:hypothetical protein
LASAILDPSKPDCDIDPMDPKKNMDVYNIRLNYIYLDFLLDQHHIFMMQLMKC